MEKKGVILTDFDGTLVEKLDPRNPLHWRRNVLKTGLEEIEGWQDFFQGALSIPGITMGGVVSRRPDIGIRRRATEKFLAGTILDQPETEVALTGSEVAKARYIVDVAIANGWMIATGMVEDMPQRLVPELIKQFALREVDQGHKPSLLIAAVNSPHLYERIGKAIDRVKAMEDPNISCRMGAGAARFSSPQATIDVVPLRIYSKSIGEGFGNALYDNQ